MSEMKVTSELENELSLALEEAAERANRLECDRDGLLTFAKAARDLWEPFGPEHLSAKCLQVKAMCLDVIKQAES